MGLTVTTNDVHALGDGVWSIALPPHQVRLFGDVRSSVGAKSIILLKSHKFDPETRTLVFQVDDAVALNVGTQNAAIVVASDRGINSRVADAFGANPNDGETLGPGDRQFLRMTAELLPAEMHRAATSLLEGVRARSSGDLLKGKSRNFSETPDNFWYVIVQPRVEQLSVTVRGAVQHFNSVARLPIKDDRGNTLFKISSGKDIPAALDLIFHAKRRP